MLPPHLQEYRAVEKELTHRLLIDERPPASSSSSRKEDGSGNDIPFIEVWHERVVANNMLVEGKLADYDGRSFAHVSPRCREFIIHIGMRLCAMVLQFPAEKHGGIQILLPRDRLRGIDLLSCRYEFSASPADDGRVLLDIHRHPRPEECESDEHDLTYLKYITVFLRAY